MELHSSSIIICCTVLCVATISALAQSDDYCPCKPAPNKCGRGNRDFTAKPTHQDHDHISRKLYGDCLPDIEAK